MGSTEIDKQPSKDIEFFCSIIESLPKRVQEIWANCDSRILDLAFEGGDTPNNLTSLIDEKLILRLSQLKLGIEITIYHTGLYSHLD